MLRLCYISHMTTKQIKSMELLIQQLYRLKSNNALAKSALNRTQIHFILEDFLYKVGLNAIIIKIYREDYYKYHSVYALSREMHINIKTLLNYRKAYIKMFLKFYFNLTDLSEEEIPSFYDRLLSDFNKIKSKQNE